jgi:hypothetical protein
VSRKWATDEVRRRDPAVAPLVSLLADPLRLGRYHGFGWLQEVGIIGGLLAILAGFYLRGRASRQAPCERSWRVSGLGCLRGGHRQKTRSDITGRHAS